MSAAEHIDSGGGEINWNKVRSCEDDGVISGKYLFQQGDIIDSKIRPYLNKIAVADRVGMCSADMYALVVNEELASVNYLTHWIASKIPWIRGLGLGPREHSQINRTQLLTAPIPLPPLEEQRRIAGILDAADALRRRRREALALLDTLPGAIFAEMFGDRLYGAESATDPVPLSEVADINSGITKGRRLKSGEETEETAYLAVANVQDKRLDLSNVKMIEATKKERERYALAVGDLLLTEGGDPDKLGRGTVWNDEIPGAIHQNHIFRVRVTDARVQPIYLSHLLSSPYGRGYFLRMAKQTTGIASINKTQLSGISRVAA